MDPLSITTACVGLLTAISSFSRKLGPFIFLYRDARKDIQCVRSETSMLSVSLQNLQEYVGHEDVQYPDNLRRSLVDVLVECGKVIGDMSELIEKLSSRRVAERTQWTMVGRSEMNRLRTRLEAYKASLDLALEMISISIASDIRGDTADILSDTREVKNTSTLIYQQTSQLLAEIATLKLQLAQAQSHEAVALEHNFALQRFLEQSTSYAESVASEKSPLWSNTNTARSSRVHSRKFASGLPSRNLSVEARPSRANHSIDLPPPLPSSRDDADKVVEPLLRTVSRRVSPLRVKSRKSSPRPEVTRLSPPSLRLSSSTPLLTPPPSASIHESASFETLLTTVQAEQDQDTQTVTTRPSSWATAPEWQNSAEVHPEQVGKVRKKTSSQHSQHTAPDWQDFLASQAYLDATANEAENTAHDWQSSLASQARLGAAADGAEVNGSSSTSSGSSPVGVAHDTIKSANPGKQDDGKTNVVEPEVVWVSTWRLVDIFELRPERETALERILKALQQGAILNKTVRMVILERRYRGLKCSSLLQAAILNWPDSCEIVQVLIEHGLDIRAEPVSTSEECCGSALQAAVIAGQTKMVKFVLSKGVDVNAAGGWHGTALQAAAWSGSGEMVKVLLDAGADVGVVSGACKTAFRAAALRSTSVLETLLMRTSNFAATRHLKGGALRVAARFGSLQSVELLLSWWADPDFVEADFAMPWQEAACRSGPESLVILESLLEGSSAIKIYDHYQEACKLVEKGGESDLDVRASKLLLLAKMHNKQRSEAGAREAGQTSFFVDTGIIRQEEQQKQTLAHVRSKMQNDVYLYHPVHIAQLDRGWQQTASRTGATRA